MPTKNVNCIAIQYGALNSRENAISRWKYVPTCSDKLQAVHNSQNRNWYAHRI